jgi:integrase
MNTSELDVVEKLWLTNIAAETSKTQYRIALRKFTEFTEKTPEELLDIGKDNVEVLRTYLNEFWNHNKKIGLSDNRTKQLETAMKSFFSWNGVKVKTAHRKVARKYRRKLYNKEMARKCIHFAEPMWAKFFIMVAWYTAMRLGDIRKLKYGVVKDMIDQSDTFPRKHTQYFVYEYKAEKRGNEARAVFCPELLKQLKKYIKWKVEEEKTPLKYDSPLFTTRSGNGRIAGVSKRTIVYMVHETVIKAEFITRKELGRYVNFNPYGLHAIRATFGTFCEDVPKIGYVEKKFLMAHKPKDIESAYALINNNKLIELYKALEPYLLLYTTEEELKNKERSFH